MKHFLIRISILILLVIFTLAVGEVLVRSIPNSYKYKHNWMCKHADEVEVIILGSSHTYYAVSPRYMKHRSFNLANTSQNLNYDCYLLKYYAEHYKNLKYVILPISYFTLFTQDYEDTENWWYAINYKIYMDCPYHSDFSKYNFEISHLSVYGGKLKKMMLGRKGIMCDTLGWGTDFSLSLKTPSRETNTAESAVKRHTNKDWGKDLNRNMGYLEEIVLFTKRHDYQLIFITTPVWHAYYDRLDKKQLGKMYEVIHKLQMEYDISYYDFMKDKRFVEDDFYDSDHLSDVGAKKFTEILERECLQ